jgi:hypothetical protein
MSKFDKFDRETCNIKKSTNFKVMVALHPQLVVMRSS